MSTLRRVLLLLCVAVLLREGSSNSPLDFLRDFKNKIFGSGNLTDSMDDLSVQCSGHDQGGVCTLQQTAINATLDENENIKSLERFEVSEYTNDTISSAQEITTIYQVTGDENVMEDLNNANNTQYYDEHEWNNTTSNNTDNYGNDFEYPDSGVNVTSLDNETQTSVDDIKNETDTRSKRQINNVQINIKLKTPGEIYKPSTVNTTVFLEKLEDSTDISTKNESNDTTDKTEETSIISNISKGQNNLNRLDVKEGNESEAQGVNREIYGSENIVNDGQSTNETTKTDFEDLEDVSSNDTSSNFKESQNFTMETNDIDESSFINNTDSKNYTAHDNISKIKDILDNSTVIIKKIVENIVPVITEINNATNTIGNNTTYSTNKNNSIDSMYNQKETSAFSLTNITDEDNENTAENATSHETYNYNNTNTTKPHPMEPTFKREKRNINFTILSDSDETDFSRFPETNDNAHTQLESSTETNSTEALSNNGTQEIEIVGPVCKKQYEECTNNTDCCEDYDCVETTEKNSTMYCDLRPSSTHLPIEEENTE